MPFVLLEILLPLIIAFLLGLFFGWLWWGWRRTKITYTEWETMRQKASRASSIEAETELAELRAERDRLQAEIDDHVCEVSDASLGAGVLGLSGAAAATDDDSDTASDESGDASSNETADASSNEADDTSDSDSNGADSTEAADADAGGNDSGARPVTGERHPYGDGSHAPFSDNSGDMPDGYPIKGNVDSMLYHREDSRSYKVTIAEVWFATPEAAEAAGFGLASSHPKDS